MCLPSRLSPLGVTAVVAQSDPIAARKALMKANNGNASESAREMIARRSSRSIWPAKVNGDLRRPSRARCKACSPTIPRAGDTAALPAVWENKARLRCQDREVRRRRQGRRRDKVKDLDSFKAALAEVGKNCGGCHDTYRKQPLS